VEFIKSNKVGGVFVCYKNSGEKETNIHLGSSVITHSEAKDELFSLTEPFAKVYKDEVLIVNKKYQKGNSDIEVTLVESPNVLMITSFPGDNFNYSLEGVNAVIIKPYHSGTLNTENNALKSFLMRAKDIKTPVFICNFDDKKCYETVKAYKDLELIVLPFCTIPAIYSKIWIAVSKKEDIKEFVLREIANEFIN
jgi:L-asparaginase/Glu-tRNA(Gln) amidotransferase subunit D